MAENLRDYKFGTIGRDANGEPIYRLSEMYVPEDQELKTRIVAYNKRNLMAIRDTSSAVTEGKVKRKQKCKEIQQKLSNYYKTHKPRILDDIDYWLPSASEYGCTNPSLTTWH